MNWLREKTDKLVASRKQKPEGEQQKDYLFEAILILVMVIPMTLAEPRPSVFMSLCCAVVNLFMASRARDKIKNANWQAAAEASKNARLSSLITLSIFALNCLILLSLNFVGN